MAYPYNFDTPGSQYLGLGGGYNPQDGYQYINPIQYQQPANYGVGIPGSSSLSMGGSLNNLPKITNENVRTPGTESFWDKWNNPQGWGTLLQGIGSLGNIWMGHQALSLGKQRFNFDKQLATRNYQNQAKAYNTDIERRARSNAASLGHEGADREQYVSDITSKEKLREDL